MACTVSYLKVIVFVMYFLLRFYLWNNICEYFNPLFMGIHFTYPYWTSSPRLLPERSGFWFAFIYIQLNICHIVLCLIMKHFHAVPLRSPVGWNPSWPHNCWFAHTVLRPFLFLSSFPTAATLDPSFKKQKPIVGKALYQYLLHGEHSYNWKLK